MIARRPSASARLSLACPSFVLLFAVSCAAPEAAESARAEPAAPAPDPAAVARIEADVAWLADDAREGRRAGEEGERSSAAWIADRLEMLGLEPAGELGYFQRFDVPLAPQVGSPAQVGKRVPLTGGGGLATVTQQGIGRVAPLFCSTSGEVRAPLVFRGYGIVDEERGRDDYAGVDVDGSVVMVLRGTPPEEEGPWGFGASVLHKVMTAKRNGASAVIVTQRPDDESDPLAFDAGREANAGIPCLYLEPGVAGWLWAGASAGPTEESNAAFASLCEDAAAADGPDDVRVYVEVIRAGGKATNVLGRLPGRGDAPTIVVGAHYDHLGRGGPGSLAPDAGGAIHNGADDNASGTAAVLELARRLAEGPLPAGDVVFALWSGEELGLIGSRHWCANPTVPLADVALNLNLDMVGRADTSGLEVMGVGTADGLEPLVADAASRSGLDADLTLSGFGVGGSDHQSFLAVGVPAVHLFTGLHDHYHRPSDDVEIVEEAGVARIVALCAELVEGVQATGALAFVAPPEDPEERRGGRRGFDVRFGTRPADYSERGGVTLAGVSPGTPAERAGLIAGDTLLEVAGVQIDGIQDFVYVLRTHKPGDVVKTVFRRDGEEHEVLVTLDSNVVE